MLSGNGRQSIGLDTFSCCGDLLRSLLDKSIVIAALPCGSRVGESITLSRTCLKRLWFTSRTNLFFCAHNVGSQKVRQVGIIVLRFILVFKQGLDLGFLRGTTENRILSGSKSVGFFTIEILWSDFTNRAWGNTLIILLIGSNRLELECVIWINPKLTDRKVQRY
jgi:hypothetical protein